MALLCCFYRVLIRSVIKRMKFQKGQSGNPSGRPKGQVVRKMDLRRERIEGRESELIDKAISMALEGDTVMLKLCIDKLLPSMKPIQAPINLPELSKGADLLTTGVIAIHAASSGEITTGEASDLLGAISSLVRLEEHIEVKREIKELRAIIEGSLPDRG